MIYQIKAVVQSNTRPCRQWKRQFIFNIKLGVVERRGRRGREEEGGDEAGEGRERDLPGCGGKKNMGDRPTCGSPILQISANIRDRKEI